ncbi:unnamed protein product [Cunninghamella blakesleeana]
MKLLLFLAVLFSLYQVAFSLPATNEKQLVEPDIDGPGGWNPWPYPPYPPGRPRWCLPCYRNGYCPPCYGRGPYEEKRSTDEINANPSRHCPPCYRKYCPPCYSEEKDNEKQD